MWDIGTLLIRAGIIGCSLQHPDLLRCQALGNDEVASPVGIPGEFNLLISGNIAKRPCRVAWVKDKRIGVAFKPG